MNYVKSCGFVAYKRENGQLLYLIIVSQNGDVGFPKGHMERGENEIETAIRELREETGVEVKITRGFRQFIEYEIKNAPYKDNAHTVKQVVYFLGECISDKIICQEAEVKEALFLSYENAIRILTFAQTKGVLERANEFLHQNRNL